ncbi:hypothetical protein BH11CYA1_BH11CYA1_45950 [soil metagenome]
MPNFRADAAKPSTEGQTQPDTGHLLGQSYLELGVDKAVGLVVSDEKLRKEVDHYGTELIKTAALFTRGKYGAIGTLALYGLASASPDAPIATQAEDFALGAVKGGATRSLLNHIPKVFSSAPTKGILVGIGSRAIDITVSHDTFTAPSKTLSRLNQELLDPKAIAFDAATWTLGEGLFKGANTVLKGALAKNATIGSMTMGGSFGLITGGSNEIVRQNNAGESFNLTKVVERSLLEGSVTAVAGGIGHKLSPAEAAKVEINRGQNIELVDPKKLGTTSGADRVVTPEPNANAKIDSKSEVVVTGEGLTVSQTPTLADLIGKTKTTTWASPDFVGDAPVKSTSLSSVGDGPAKSTNSETSKPREFIIDAGKSSLKILRAHNTENTLLKVREVIRNEDGTKTIGPKQKLFVQKLGASEALHPDAAKADIIVSSHPEVLTAAEKAKHAFPEAEGKVWLTTGRDNRLLLSTGDNPVSQWRKHGYVEPIRLDHGNTTLSVMAPLMVGEIGKQDSPQSKAEWVEFDRQLGEAKKSGVDSVSTDVWWGLVEPSKGKFDWSYYEKISDHITKAGLKWVPILSFHQCGGNVGDNVSVPLPAWIWGDLAAKTPGGNAESLKYKSEQGHSSTEYLSLWADHLALERYGSVMKEFQSHFTSRAKDIAEVNISLGPAGELRYPSYNSHDQNAGYPTRGALQAYSDLAQNSFRDYAMAKYGGADGVSKAWAMANLTPETIKPPSETEGFFQRGDHFNTQYGRDFFDWYNQSLIDHGQRVMTTAKDVFGQRTSSFYGIDLGAKIPGVHWRVGEWQGGNVILGDRMAELNAGLIRTSRGDWDNNADGRGYRPLLSMFSALQPAAPGTGSRIVPFFTAVEMPDGVDGPPGKAMPNTLAKWVGEEASRQGLFLKGENALNGNLYVGENWDRMKALLALPKQHGDYHGLTFLRMSDVVNNDVARAKVSEMNYARRSVETLTQYFRNILKKAS